MEYTSSEPEPEPEPDPEPEPGIQTIVSDRIYRMDRIWLTLPNP